LSPGQIDRGKDIFHRGLLGIEANGKQVLLGVIGYLQDTPESGDGGAHGVRAADSDKSSPLYQARHPEIDAGDLHGKSSLSSIHRFHLQPARWLIEWGKRLYLTKFCLSSHHGGEIFPGGGRRRLTRGTATLAK
jgi:hypothetical protein